MFDIQYNWAAGSINVENLAQDYAEVAPAAMPQVDHALGAGDPNPQQRLCGIDALPQELRPGGPLPGGVKPLSIVFVNTSAAITLENTAFFLKKSK